MSKYKNRNSLVDAQCANTIRLRNLRHTRLAFCSSIALATLAYAQNITGGLHGIAAEGAMVEVIAPATGFAKTLTAGSKGEYSIEQLNPGTYVVKISKDGHEVGRASVQITPNVTTTVPKFDTSEAAANSTAATLAEVTVSGQSMQTVTTPIDVTTPELINNYSAELTHHLPISQTTPYAPYLLQSSSRSFGGYYQTNGASVSENRIYFNEFDTNYDVSGLGGITFPQDAVVDTQLINGSGGLAWTSTTGGIVSATLKQGNNEFHGGYTANIYPSTSNLLRPHGDDATYTLPSGKQAYSLYQSADRSGESIVQDIWASGPIIQDKLFFFVLLGNSPSISTVDTYKRNTAQLYSSRDKNFMFNVTWDITSNQSLNIAGARDWSSSSTNQYQLAENYKPSSITGEPIWSGDLHRTRLLIGNYHWRINDDLSLRVMGGYTRLDVPSFDSSDPKTPYVDIYDYNTDATTHYGPAAYDAPNNYYYARRGYKADMNWTLGDHTFTFGADRYKNNFHFVPYWRPYWAYTLNSPAGPLDNGVPIPADGNYVTNWIGHFGGDFGSEQFGEYAYDTWKLTDRIVLTGGVRWDHMASKEGDAQTFLNLHNVSPRIGAAWDVRGDSTLKLGLNIGIYTLPMPSGLNYFVGGSNYIAGANYTYTGMDPVTHAPLGLTPLGPPVIYSDGQSPDPLTLSARNLKNTSQHNIQFYMQQQLTPSWSFLAQFDLNQLDNIVDFISDSSGTISNYVRAHGYPNYPGLGTGGVLFNPGRDVVLRGYLNGDSTLHTLVIPNSYLGVPHAARNYYDLNFQLEHPNSVDDPYYLALNYTWAHLYGNVDGYSSESRASSGIQTSSSVLQTAGRSGNFNYPELFPGSYGNLAADIRHKLVASSIYYWQSGWRVSSIFTAQTGAPYGCFGTYPDVAAVKANPNLGGSTHYCRGGQLVPLNSLGRYPFSWRLDMGVGYNWTIADTHVLDLTLNVTNLTNRQTVRTRNTQSDTGTASLTPNPSYLAVTTLQAPRFTSLVVRYSF
jgi:hypothetical protein